VGKIPQSAGKNFGRLEKISRHWGIFPTAFWLLVSYVDRMWKSFPQMCISEERRWKLSRALSDSQWIKDENNISLRYVSYKIGPRSNIFGSASNIFGHSSYITMYRDDRWAPNCGKVFHNPCGKVRTSISFDGSWARSCLIAGESKMRAIYRCDR
jgi:hypothetical protein